MAARPPWAGTTGARPLRGGAETGNGWVSSAAAERDGADDCDGPDECEGADAGDGSGDRGGSGRNWTVASSPGTRAAPNDAGVGPGRTGDGGPG
ncbi:hypothetical protein GCM10010172_75170 [Paractinoplanes ferrugineus]|uniref:Uncharacterized protein n=1 Tax=Paractinoplanes ferrugineus TaxID=113564 RepID=A0A919MD25_9ACTN|nr:hypothetical protein Afe05nite_31680 [Actinoplanes ferrugineus]